VLDRGKTIERDADGRTVRAIGTHTDITAQKKAQARLAETAAALRAEKERLRVTLHAIGDAVICTDASENVSFMNAAAEALTGRTADESIGRPLAEIYCPRDEETDEAISVADEIAGGKARAHNRAVIVRPDGSRSSIRQVVSPIITTGEVMNGSVIVFQDVTDARTLQRQLAHAASHDSLTGLANRASFLATMRELLDEARNDDAARHQLLFIDLDRFKFVNDSAGHGAGDALLKQIARTLEGCVRRSDFVARLGGDEFGMILKHCDVETAVREAGKVVAAVSEIEFAWEGERFSVGASIGIASITPDSNAIDEIIANADRGCYAAKSAGRGTVSVHEPKAA
jgi:diguanylate cyclase (GGDEF)-like protein/PAS domain S-box-containing protein